MKKFFISFVAFIILLVASPAFAENVKTGCASGCDYDDCGDWATYLDGLGNFSEDQKLDVQGTMTGRCYLTSLQLNGHKVRIIGNASCRDDDGVVDAGDCTITSDHSTATILADSSGTYEVDGVVVKNTGTRGDGVAEAAGIWLNDTVAFTLSNSMVVFAGSGDADNANNAGVLVGYDITSLVVYNTGFQGWTTGLRYDMRDSDSLKVYNSTFRGNALKDIEIDCWRGASEVVDLRNVLILSSSDSLYFNDTCDSITKTDVFCSAADTDCSDYSKSISFDGTGADFRIASASDGVDEGTDLSAATPAITTDMRGAARDATYDVGSYEIAETPPDPTPTPTAPPATPTATAPPDPEPTMTDEICGDGVDNGESSGTKGSCPTNYVDALVGDGCDLLCVGTVDKDRDGFNSDGTLGSYGTTDTDCDDTNRMIYNGSQRDCGTDGTQTCQSDGTWTDCAEGELCEATTGKCYYVSATGTTSAAGTYADPFSINCVKHYLSGAPGCNVSLAPGDYVYFMGGTYNSQYSWGDKTATLVNYANGTEGNPITFKAYPGETPIFSTGCSDPDTCYILYSEYKDYVKLEGLTFTGGYGSGIVIVSGEGWEIERNILYDIDGYANYNQSALAFVSGGSPSANHHIHHNIMYDNYDRDVPADPGLNNNSHILFMGNDSHTGTQEVDHNVIFNTVLDADETSPENGGRCIKTKHSNDSLTDLHIHHNIFGKCFGGGYYGEYSHVTSEYNIVMDSDLCMTVDGDSPVFKDIIFRNNLCIDSDKMFIDTVVYTGTPTDVNINNNVIKSNSDYDSGDLGHRGIVAISPYGSDANYDIFIDGGILNFSGNCYYNEDVSGIKFQVYSSGSATQKQSYESLATWSSGVVGETGAVEEDPVFNANNEPTSTNCAGMGWILPLSAEVPPTYEGAERVNQLNISINFNQGLN
jgi:hypothetical protein